MCFDLEKGGNIFKFTSTGNECCAIGDRIPELFFGFGEGRLRLETQIGNKGNFWMTNEKFMDEIDVWYHFEVEQSYVNNKVKRSIFTCMIVVYFSGWSL